MATWRVCPEPDCPNLSQRGRCEEHQRPNATQRGYTGKGHQMFRKKVLRRDKVCVLCGNAEATQADHYPVDRRTLILRGENPNDPRHGRGLCHSCHSTHTALHQGFAAGS